MITRIRSTLFLKCSFFLYFLFPHASLFYNILQRFFYFSILFLIYSIFILFNFYSTPLYSTLFHFHATLFHLTPSLSLNSATVAIVMYTPPLTTPSLTINCVIFCQSFILLHLYCAVVAVKYKHLKATDLNQLPCIVRNRKDKNPAVTFSRILDKGAMGAVVLIVPASLLLFIDFPSPYTSSPFFSPPQIHPLQSKPTAHTHTTLTLHISLLPA